MIYLSPQITVAQAAKIAKDLGCRLVQDLHGDVVITPRPRRFDEWEETKIKAPHHQYFDAGIPEPESS
jgi:hypothetical protein